MQAPIAKLQTMWRMFATAAHNQPDLVREGCVKMRNYVVKMRKLTALQFRSPEGHRAFRHFPAFNELEVARIRRESPLASILQRCRWKANLR